MQSFGTEVKLSYLHIFPIPAINVSKFLVDLVFPVKVHYHLSVDYNEQREKEKATPKRTGHSFQNNCPSRSISNAPFQYLSAGQIFPQIRHLDLPHGRPFHPSHQLLWRGEITKRAREIVRIAATLIEDAPVEMDTRLRLEQDVLRRFYLAIDW